MTPRIDFSALPVDLDTAETYIEDTLANLADAWHPAGPYGSLADALGMPESMYQRWYRGGVPARELIAWWCLTHAG